MAESDETVASIPFTGCGSSIGGVEGGERFSPVPVGAGDALGEVTPEVGLEISPMANVAARSLSSRVDLCDLLVGDVEGLGERCEASDLRKLFKADSANWLEDKGEVARRSSVGLES